jgi:2-C-methyl-D-erythritol 4-phosphate cytidylyltransferase/2-C-methyl-D-erythritol 2,4-cyclodiphosphate synthase
MLKALERDPKASGVVPVVALRDTLKKLNGKLETLPDRDNLVASQTPQLAKLGALRAALTTEPRIQFIDEAQALEAAGKKVLAFPGDPLNLKITFPQDLELLEQAWELTLAKRKETAAVS